MAELLALQIARARCSAAEMFGRNDICPSHCGGGDSNLPTNDQALTPIPALLRRPTETIDLKVPGFEKAALLNETEAESEIEYCCFTYLVRTPERLILIDTGFNSLLLDDNTHCTEYRSVIEQLAALNITPQQITDVVITHGHWSNIGGLANFLQARIFISVREINVMGRVLEGGKNMYDAYRWEDMRTVGMASRLHLVKRGLAIDEHLRLDVVGGHTHGFLLPTFMTRGVSRVMVAADNVPMYRHLRGDAFPLDWCCSGSDVRERLKTRMHTAFALPGRDPEIFKRFPVIAPGIARIFTDEGEEH